MADRTVSVKLTADVADYIAKMTAAGKSTRDLEQADRNLKNAHDAAENAAGKARVSEENLASVRSDSKATTVQLAQAEEQHDANLRKLDSSIRDVTKAEGDYQIALRRSADEQDNSNKKTNDSIDAVAKKTSSAFSPLAFLGLSAGLPAAAAIGVAGAGLALGGIATIFAGLGVAIAAQDDQIKQHFKQTMSGIGADAKTMGDGFKAEVNGALDAVTSSWQRLSPAVHAAVDASAPAVRTLTGAVTDFAENAMPGMVTAVVSSQPALEGLRQLTAQTGSGLSAFFTNIASGSVAAGAGLSNLGGTVNLLLGRLGTLFANLANGSAGPLNSLHVIIDQLTGGLNALTAQGSGALGFLQGFTNAGAGMVTTLSGIASLISLLPPQVTQLAGSFTSVALVASKFGIDAGKGFEGLGGKISAVQGPIAKMGTAVGGLARGAINPAFLAVSALGIGLDLLGQKQAEAAAAAAAHAQNVANLTEALRADNGALGANTAATVAKALQDKNAAANTQVFGASLGEATAAATGNADALTSVTTKSNAFLQSMVASGALTQGSADHLKTLNEGLLQNGGSWDTASFQAYGYTEALASQHPELMSMLEQTFNATGAIGEQAAATRDALGTLRDYNNAISGNTQTLQGMFGAATGAKSAVAELAADFAKLAGAGNDAAAAGKAIIDIMRVMSGQAPSVDEAMQSWNDHMRLATTSFAKAKKEATDFKDGMISAAGAIDTTSQSGSELQDVMTQAATDMATYGKTLKDSGQSADQITPKLQSMRDEFDKHLKTLGLTDDQISKISDHYGLIPTKIVTTLGLDGNTEAQQEIQGLIGQLKTVGEGKTVPVKVLSDSAKQALIELGYQIVQLPDGTFQVAANTDQGRAALDDFKKTIDATFSVVHIQAEDEPAQATVTEWTKRTNGTTGWTTLDTKIDPATGKVTYWKQQADGTWGYSTLDTRIDPATNKVQGWVRQANGTYAWATLDARTQAAEDALNQAARDRTATINVRYNVAGLPQLPAGANRAAFADGGVAKMASGGILGMAGGGGLSPMGSIAAKIPPNTWRVIGDRMKDDEYYIPADGSARSKAVLSAAMSDPKLGNIGGQIANGFAAVGAMSHPIVVHTGGGGASAGLSPQMVSALLGQMVAAVQTGLSQAQFNLDNRGVATASAQGRALNALR